ncbi:MAG TPA: phosphate signaling complex protein PhoU [Candidatus Saccharimonadia bacterium]|nr:phosphate signaling complex protein PhoU [Candidatus Saccharimonadia bacterium]
MHTQHDHIVKQYDAELDRLTGEIARMGAIAVEQLHVAIDALEARDDNTARRVIAHDSAIDRLEQEVSHDVVRLLALRQPMASDLREILAALKIASDIERIGDYAANVAKRSLVLNTLPAVAAGRGLRALSQLAGDMLGEVLAAYRDRDDEAALRVRARDADLDAMYTALFRELLTYMAEDPRHISSSIHLLFIAKNIERIGDHVTNIAENAWFVVHGELPPEPREKRDQTASPHVSPAR